MKLEMSDPLQHFLINNVELHEEIGRGGNGVVYRGSWQGAPCAVKKMEFSGSPIKDSERKRMKEKFMTECERSSVLRHPNIVHFLGVQISGDAFPSLVMERLHSNLTDLLKANPKIPFEMKFSFIHDVAKGVNYLHTYTPTIIHRDLSTNNVLVSTGMVAKIGDLGTMRFVDGQRLSQMTREARTADFMPPEVLFGTPVYGTAMDVFSFACVCLHTLSHKWPTPSQPVETVLNSPDLKTQSEAQRRSTYMEGIDDDIRDLATSCLNNSAEKRPSIGEVCTQLELIMAKQKFPPSVTLFDAHLSIKAHYKEIEKLKEVINFKDAQISSLQELKNERELELEAMMKELANKDAEVQRNKMTIQQRKIPPTKLHAYLTIQESADHSKQLENNVTTHYARIEETQARESNNFWSTLKVTQQHRADLLVKCWPTSVAELNGKVYIIAEDSNGATYPYVYDLITGKWSQLPELPYYKCSLVTVPDEVLVIGGCKKIKDVVEVSGQVFVWSEDNKKWIVKYVDMSTARFSSSSISHELKVIVAGGVTCYNPWTVTNTVEILSIGKDSCKTHWVKVEQLPYVVYGAVPLIMDDNLYIAGGFDVHRHGMCKIVMASLSELQKSDTSIIQAWSRLPDVPYFSLSINHYQSHLIVFTGVSLGEEPSQDKPIHQFHLYNPDTKSWDYIATASEGYIWGRSVHIKDDVIFVVGGTTGTIYRGKDNNLVKTCLTLSFVRKGRRILHNAF